MSVLTIPEVNGLIKILGATGQIFTAEFIKKDGSIRVMNCRTGVKKHLKGGKLAFNPADYKLLPVYDLKAKGYRFVNLKTLRKISYGGSVHYVFKG